MHWESHLVVVVFDPNSILLDPTRKVAPDDFSLPIHRTDESKHCCGWKQQVMLRLNLCVVYRNVTFVMAPTCQRRDGPMKNAGIPAARIHPGRPTQVVENTFSGHLSFLERQCHNCWQVSSCVVTAARTCFSHFIPRRIVKILQTNGTRLCVIILPQLSRLFLVHSRQLPSCFCISPSVVTIPIFSPGTDAKGTESKGCHHPPHQISTQNHEVNPTLLVGDADMKSTSCPVNVGRSWRSSRRTGVQLTSTTHSARQHSR
jgi:hypothetical protein